MKTDREATIKSLTPKARTALSAVFPTKKAALETLRAVFGNRNSGWFVTDSTIPYLDASREAPGNYFGFPIANREEQAAWFHTKEAAERFNQACGGELGPIQTMTYPDPEDIMDTPEKPWTKE